MPITVAELQTELDLNDKKFTSKMDSAQKRVETFAGQEFKAPELDINITRALDKLGLVRESYRNLKREIEGSMRMGVPGFTMGQQGAGGTGGSGPAFRPSTANPEKIMATSAAAVNQIARVAQAQSEAALKKAESNAILSAVQIDKIRSEGAAKAAASQVRIETEAAAKAEGIRASAEAATTAKVEGIRTAATARAEESAKAQAGRLEAIDKESETRRQTTVQTIQQPPKHVASK